jgi:hypothetical protein
LISSNNVPTDTTYNLLAVAGSELTLDGLNVSYYINDDSQPPNSGGGFTIQAADEFGYSENSDFSTQVTMRNINLISGQVDAVLVLGDMGFRVENSYLEAGFDCIRYFGGRNLEIFNNRLRCYKPVFESATSRARAVVIGSPIVPFNDGYVDTWRIHGNVLEGWTPPDAIQTGIIRLVDLESPCGSGVTVAVHDNQFFAVSESPITSGVVAAVAVTIENTTAEKTPFFAKAVLAYNNTMAVDGTTQNKAFVLLNNNSILPFYHWNNSGLLSNNISGNLTSGPPPISDVPYIVTATAEAEGTSLIVTFSEAMTVADPLAGMVITGTTAMTILSANPASLSGDTEVTFTTDIIFETGSTPSNRTLQYQPSNGDYIGDSSGLELRGFPYPITNVLP